MMLASRPPCPLACPGQQEIDVFLRAGVDIMMLATPLAMKIAVGRVAADGLFEPDAAGDRWAAFDEPLVDDLVFWNRSSGKLCSWSGRAFALGQAVIDDPTTYSFDCNLNIFADPLDWLRANRDGIVVLPDKWPLAFDRLRECPRVAIAEQLLPLYRRHMKPSRLPGLMILPEGRRAA